MSSLQEKLAEVKAMEDAGLSSEVESVAIGFRLSAFNVFTLDELASRFGQTRSGMAKILIQDSLAKCHKTLGTNFDQHLQDYVNHLKGKK
jgi:hypothetical protein